VDIKRANEVMRANEIARNEKSHREKSVGQRKQPFWVF